MERRFQVGDKIRFRDWEELMVEFRPDNDFCVNNNIPALKDAVPYMRNIYLSLKNSELYVTRCLMADDFPCIRFKGDPESYYWDERFFEPAIPELQIDISFDEILALF